MKGHHIGLSAAIALFCLFGLLEKALSTEIDDPWYGIEDWQELKTEQLHPIVLDLAASEDPKKLVFAAILGTRILEEEEEEETEEAGRRLIAQETLDNWRKMALEKSADDEVWVFTMLATFPVANFSAAKSDNARAVREQALLRWQQAEPDNLAPLLHQTGLSTSELFERSKTRHQFTEYNYPIMRWMYQILVQQLPDQQKNIVSVLLGIHGRSAVFPARPLLEVCKKNPPQQASADWQSCRFIAKTLRQSSGSTAIPAIVGASILQTLATDETEKQIALNERAYLGWLLNQHIQQIKGVRLFEYYLKILQDNNINSEPQAIERFLLQKGLPLKPDEESLKPLLEKYKQ